VILVVDSSLSGVSMALLRPGAAEPVAAEFHVENMGAVAAIADLAERVLAAGQTKVAAIQGVAVSVGPGSFTGIKVGLAFVYGLQQARDGQLPVLGVSAVEAAAERFHAEQGGVPMALFVPATRTHGFVAVHGINGLEGARLLDVGGAEGQAFVARLPAETRLGVFSRWPLCDSLIKEQGRSLLELAPARVCREAIHGMAKRAALNWPGGYQLTAPAPRYLRLSTAEERLQELAAGQAKGAPTK
jgi:tRNA threonylcarbamoyl adenosine modification protein YeaZ